MENSDKNKTKKLDCEITEILMCMYNSGDTTNCLADIKKLILEAEIKKGLQDFQICREELQKQREKILNLDCLKEEKDREQRGSSIDYNFDVEIKNQLRKEIKEEIKKL